MAVQLNCFTDVELTDEDVMDVIRWADRHGNYEVDNELYELEQTMSYFHDQLERGHISQRSYDELLRSHRLRFAQKHWMDFKIWEAA